MAQQLITDQQVLGANPDYADIERKKKIAELLMGEATEQPKGQMISGYYVAPSWSQMLNPVAKAIAGTESAKSAETKQTALVNALRGKKSEETKEISDAIQAKDWNKASSLIAASETGAGQEYKPLLAKFLVPEQLSQKDKEELRLRELEIKQRANQAAAQLAQSRVPMGYRMTQGGTLEAIPGGPADLKLQTKVAGAADVDLAIGSLRDKYNKLNELNAIQNTEKSALANIGASASSSGIGQSIGNMLGTQAASARNSIAMERPKLLAAIQKATGMSAKQIDSNAELKLWLTAATDPTKDYAANMEALDNIEKSLGSLSIQASGQQAPAANTSGWSIKSVK